MKKRVLSLMLCLSMLCSLFAVVPVSASAVEGADEKEAEYVEDAANPVEEAGEPAEETQEPAEEAGEPAEEVIPVEEDDDADLKYAGDFDVGTVLEGSCGEHVTWSLDPETGVLTISGTGAMANYPYSSKSPWYDYRENIKTAVIGKDVTTIGNYAFYDCNNLTSVEIPDTVTSIGTDAFYGCSALTSITIPSGVTIIEPYTFYKCENLKEVNFSSSNNVTEIGWNAFYQCSSLTGIDVPKVTKIEEGAFYRCTSLTMIDIPNVTNIGQETFYGCTNLTSVTSTDNLLKIDEYAFCECRRLSNIALPDSMTFIGYAAFSDCKSLTQINIPTGIKYLNYYIFSGCSGLTSITIPSNIKEILGGAFSGCTGLTSIVIPSGVPKIECYTFCNCTKLESIEIPDTVEKIEEHAFYNCQKLKNFEIPNSVTSIGEYAFHLCFNLTDIKIPDSVTTIEDEAFYNCSRLENVLISENVVYLGDYVFGACDALTNITFLGKNPTEFSPYCMDCAENIKNVTVRKGLTDTYKKFFSNPDAITFTELPLEETEMSGSCGEKMTWNLNLISGVLSITGSGEMSSVPWSSERLYIKTVNIGDGVKNIKESAFDGCDILSSVSIADSVKNIETNAFRNCISLKSITIPGNVVSMGADAFSGCSSLADITILYGVKSIDKYAFRNCTGLKNITIPDSVTNIEEYAFYGCNKLVGITIPNGVTNIGKYAFYDCKKLVSITIPNGVTSIGNSAFNYCIGLTQITIPNSVTSIEDGVFACCSRLTEITIPDSVTSIGNSAFHYCTGLTKITIPDSVTSIGSNIFNHCTGLAQITIPNSVTSIGNSAFYACDKLVSITIPNGVTSIGNSAFEYCRGLTQITIPNSVTSIGNSAFSSCTGLTEITIPSSVTSISSYTFYECSGLTQITIPNSVTSIGRTAFGYCSGLTQITIPNSVTSIGNSAFSGCTGLTKITLPDSVTKIEAYAFKNCGLTSLSIPESVTSVDYGAFGQNDYLTTVEIFSKNPTGFNKTMFDGTNNISSFKVPVDCASAYAEQFPAYADIITGVKTFVVDGNGCLTQYNGAVSVLELPSTVRTIQCGAIQNHDELTALTILSSVTTVEEGAIADCPNLKTIYLHIQKGVDLPGLLSLSGVTFKVYAGTPAEEYCKENNLTFELISQSTVSTASAALTETDENGNTVASSKTIPESISNNTAVTSFTNTNVGEATGKAGATLDIQLTKANFDKSDTVTTMSFEVTPRDAKGKEISNEEITSLITFRLPVDAKLTAEKLPVYHDGVYMGLYPVLEEDGYKYLEISTCEFSTYSYELPPDNLDDLDEIKCSVSLSLKENIDINFYVSKLKKNTTASQYSVEATFDGKTTKLGTLKDDYASVKYVVASAAAAEMTKPVVFTVYYGNTKVYEKSYSVQKYCEETIKEYKNSTVQKEQELVSLCTAVLDYGAYAQQYFHVNEDALANETYSLGASALTKIPSGYPEELSGSFTGISDISASLVLESATTLRVFYTLESGQNISDFKFSYTCGNGGEETELEAIFVEGTKYCVEIKEITSCDLGKTYTITEKNGDETNTIQYSPLSYAYTVQEQLAADSALVNLVQSLYLYSNKAEAYF